MPLWKKKETVRAAFARAPPFSKHSDPHTPPKPSPKWLTPRRIAAIFQINSARKVMEENERLTKLDNALLTPLSAKKSPAKKSPALASALASALSPALSPAKTVSAKKSPTKQLTRVRKMAKEYEKALNPSPPKRITYKPLKKKKINNIEEGNYGGGRHKRTRSKKTRKTRKTRKY